MNLNDVVMFDGIRYTSPILTLSMKVCAYAKRRLAPKGATDLADVRRLLLARPELRAEEGPVAQLVRQLGDSAALAAWHELVQQPPVSDDDVDEGY
jgi:hypothetical protein